MASDQTFDAAIRVRVGSDRDERLEEIAHERSDPGNKVTKSDLVREAIDDFLEEVDTEE